MNKQTISSVRGITAIFWLGFFMAISFMEAPLKFTAPGLTMAEGLQVGKIIFGFLNKCEWFFLLVIILTCIVQPASKRGFYLIVTVSAIMIIETAWLLPLLDAGANTIIKGLPADHPSLHWSFIVLEIVKVPILLLLGWESSRTVNRTQRTP